MLTPLVVSVILDVEYPYSVRFTGKDSETMISSTDTLKFHVATGIAPRSSTAGSLLHLPAEQLINVGLHTYPNEPQLLKSICRLTQTPSGDLEYPVGQSAVAKIQLFLSIVADATLLSIQYSLVVLLVVLVLVLVVVVFVVALLVVLLVVFVVVVVPLVLVVCALVVVV